MRLMSFNEAVEKASKDKIMVERMEQILYLDENISSKINVLNLQNKGNVFVDDIVYSKGKIYSKNEKALPKSVDIKSYCICGIELSDTVYDGKKTSILFLELKEKPFWNIGAFTYPLIGKESCDLFMKEMNVKNPEELVTKEVIVYSSDKCTKGISATKYLE